MTVVSEGPRGTSDATTPLRRLATILAERARKFSRAVQVQSIPADKLQMIRLDYCQCILQKTMSLSLPQLQLYHRCFDGTRHMLQAHV